MHDLHYSACRGVLDLARGDSKTLTTDNNDAYLWQDR